MKPAIVCGCATAAVVVLALLSLSTRLARIDAGELANAADAKQQRALSHINQGCPDIAVHSDQLRLAGWLE